MIWLSSCALLGLVAMVATWHLLTKYPGERAKPQPSELPRREERLVARHVEGVERWLAVLTDDDALHEAARSLLAEAADLCANQPVSRPRLVGRADSESLGGDKS